MNKEEVRLTKACRPKDWSEVFGNSDEIAALKEAKGKFHTIMLRGEKGCGKTTIARIFSRYVGAKGRDINEYDLADLGLKDKARAIKELVPYAPVESDAKVYLFDEIQDSSKGFQGALLKITEEPPSHVYFILCTTHSEKILPTLIDRCTIYNVYPLDVRSATRHLNWACTSQNFSVDPKIISEIVKKTNGNPRVAITLLDKVRSLPTEKALRLIQNSVGVEAEEVVKNLVKELLSSKPSWKEVMSILYSIKSPPETIRRDVYNYCAGWLRNQPSKKELLLVLYEFENPVTDNGISQLVKYCYEVVYGE